jgi:hypothetical protein
MPLSKSNLKVALKALLAIFLLSGLAGVAGSQLAPDVPLLTVLLYCAFGVAIVFTILVVAVVQGGMWNQFILRHGGTDPAWFWFKGEPPGLERLREQLKEQNK